MTSKHDRKIVKSSANKKHLAGGITSFIISFMRRLKSARLSTEPCGTLFGIAWILEKWFSRWKLKFRFIRKLRSKFETLPRKSRLWKVYKILYHEVSSKAFKQSKKITSN